MSFTKKIVAGQPIVAADFAKFFGDHFSGFVKTGFEVSEGTGLVVDISAGTAYVKDASGYMYQIVSDATETTTLTDNSTNYVFLHAAATYITASTTATVPDDAILLATVVCASGDVTSVTDNRMMTPAVKSWGIWTETGTSMSSNDYFIYNGGALTTVSKYIYLPVCADKSFTLGTIQFTVGSWGGYEGSHAVSVAYNLNDSEVSIYSGTPSTATDISVVINASNTGNEDFQGYIKCTVYYYGYVKNIRFTYTYG